MNREEFDEAMLAIGSIPHAADALIWIAPDANRLTRLPYNFVPVGSGLSAI